MTWSWERLHCDFIAATTYASDTGGRCPSTVPISARPRNFSSTRYIPGVRWSTQRPNSGLNSGSPRLQHYAGKKTLPSLFSGRQLSPSNCSISS